MAIHGDRETAGKLERALAWGLAATTMPGTIELVALTVAALSPNRRKGENESPPERVVRCAVIVPAHNESALIERCVASVLAGRELHPELDVFVVADNCTDDTAERAARAGARVIKRFSDVDSRGKGYALDCAFRRLLHEPYDAFLVVDADSVVAPNLVAEICREIASGAAAVQAPYRVLNPEAGLRTRLMKVALLAFNELRPRGRARLGFSAGILGNGFALSRETLLDVPYAAHSVVEDLEYHLRLVRAGRKVVFAGNTEVRAEMPVRSDAASSQRARWEGGRFRMIADHAPGLLREALRGERRLVEPLLELLLLPLGWHTLLLAGLALVPFGPVRAYALLGLFVVLLHVVAAVLICRGGLRDLAALAAAPAYLAWKLVLLPKIWLASARGTAWIRTQREPMEGAAR